ncbi:XkdW family protein [Paenibacillus thiaminolyticus]|uniref:XkdW family protein n=1 Tax=Paenibacillus thiaminolyticus TaxID=49283 RepID=UPI002175BCB9|nr:XkdW family protein [Paenibacillus thiaminolyticus]
MTAFIVDVGGKLVRPTMFGDDAPVSERFETPEIEDDGQEDESKTLLVGYTIAIPMPDGLYQPIFDVEGYREAEADYNARYADYLATATESNPESDEPQPEPPQPVDGPSFWRNGLTDKEIEALNPPPEPSQTDVLGQELTQMKIKNIQQQSVFDSLGAELAKAKLEIIKLKGGQSA